MSRERLLLAADELDAYTSQSRVSPQTAALLRTVNRWGHDLFAEECLPECRRCAALALADAILGGTE